MQREAWLLGIAGCFITTNQLALILATDASWTAIWIVLVWGVMAYLGWLGLQRYLPEHDPYMFPAAMLLAGWGLNLISRLLPGYMIRQSAWVCLGVGALIVIAILPGHLRWLQRYRYTWLIVGLALLLATIAFGVNPSGGGPELWLGIGNFHYQPSELLKILLVVFLASYLAEYQQHFRQQWHKTPPPIRYIGPILLMWSISIVMLIWQQDLGTAALFFVVFMLMIFVASGQVSLLLSGVVLLLIGGFVAYHQFAVVALRVNIWRNPWSDPDGTAYQIVQSLMAVAAGGVSGTGIGQGNPTLIPVVHTDFTYAAIVEEWGLLGAVGAVFILLVIIVRGLRIALLIQHRPFQAYLATGLCLMLAVQSLLIMGGTLSLVPLTGVTLPFVSYGGSSLLTNFIMVGLLLVLSQDVA